MHYRIRHLFIVSFALMFGFAAAASTVAAQEETARYPVTIHQGTCESPEAEPLHDLGEAVPRSEMDDAEVLGTQEVQVFEAENSIDGQFGDLTDSEHVILVHQSADQFDTYVACGVIGGANADGQIVIPVRPLASQVVGVAVLDEDSEGTLGIGEDQVNATVYLFRETLLEATPMAGSPTPLPTQPGVPTETPEPTETPAPTETSAPTETPEPTEPPTETPEPEVIEVPTEATIELSDDGINLDEITMAANLDFALTLSNLTESEAQFSIPDLGIEETMPAGEVTTVTINADEGEYEYQVNEETGTLRVLPQAEE